MDAPTLVRVARSLLAERYDAEDHRVVCIAHSASGFHRGLHLNSSGQDVCAEAIAIANALLLSNDPIDWIVSVTHSPIASPSTRIIPPCGNCRQLLHRYCPDAQVIVSERRETLIAVPAKRLLPHAYVKPQTSTSAKQGI